jgi:hypothetical protein
MTTRRENLKRHVTKLCQELNAAGIYPEVVDGRWEVRGNAKSLFGGGICFNDEAFYHLKSKGMLNIGVCWKCGKEPISEDFKFTLPNSSKSYPICRECYKTGKRISKSVKETGGEKDTNRANYGRFSRAAVVAFGSGLLIAVFVDGSWAFPSMIIVFLIIYAINSVGN